MYFALVDTPIFNQTILRLLYDEAGMLLLLKAKLQHNDVWKRHNETRYFEHL